jgi:hypothetical protein
MSLGMMIKEQLIERAPSQQDIQEAGEKIREIADVIDDMDAFVFDGDGPEYIEMRRKITNARVNIGYIEKALGLR